MPGSGAEVFGHFSATLAAVLSQNPLPGYLVLHLLLGDPDIATLEVGLAELLRPELLTPPTAKAPRQRPGT
jgi:hypothetical protein